MTGILVVAAMLHAPQIVSVTEPGNLAEQAFGLMGRTGNLVFLISLTAFAFATILGWNFYGEQAVRYLFPESRCGILIYRLFYLASVFCGAIVPMRLVWQLSDLFNGPMAVPNLLVLLLMNKEIAAETGRELLELLDEEELVLGVSSVVQPPVQPVIPTARTRTAAVSRTANRFIFI